jgi:DNA-binding beta-propeller fold protein YncE
LGIVLAAALGVPAAAHGREVVLVANAEGGTVSVVDARTFAVLRELNILPDGPNAEPGQDDPAQALAGQQLVEAAGGKNYAQDQDLAPDGRTLYVSRGHRGDVAAFDVASGKLLWKVAIPGLRADHMALTEDGKRLYASALTDNHVYAIDTATHAITGSFASGEWPHDNHVSHDGTLVYNGSIGNIVAPKESRGEYLLTIADAQTLAVKRTFKFDAGVRPYVLTHDEKKMYAQLSEYNGLIEFDLEAGKITRKLDLPVDAGVTEADYDFEAPHHGLALSLDEQTLCAAGRASDYVALVSTETLTAVKIIDVGDAPGWAANSPDGRYCFVPNTREDTLSVISYAQQREVTRIKVGDGPKQLEGGEIPLSVLCAGEKSCRPVVRLSRRCAGGGRLRLGVVGDLDAVQSVTWRFDGRRVAARSRQPFTAMIGRRELAATRARRLQATVALTGETKPVVLTRSLSRCGLSR